MNYIRIIPSLLLKNNKLVKGKNFKNHKNAGHPKTTINSLSYQGADEISILNIDDNLKLNDQINLQSIQSFSANSTVPLTFGGGINDIKTATSIIKSGFEKIYISRGIFKNKNLIKNLVNNFGGQSIVGGINILKQNHKYMILNSKEENQDIINFIKFLETQGLGEIKITFVDREGSKSGLDLNFCKLILKNTSLPCIFEGGIGNLNQIKDAIEIGVKAIGLGTLITYGDYNIIKIKSYLKNYNFNVRL